jgi:hypothetical protein
MAEFVDEIYSLVVDGMKSSKIVLAGVVCVQVHVIEVLIEAVRMIVEAESANNGFENCFRGRESLKKRP